jgi:hypothetical protein
MIWARALPTHLPSFQVFEDARELLAFLHGETRERFLDDPVFRLRDYPLQLPSPLYQVYAHQPAVSWIIPKFDAVVGEISSDGKG